MMNLAKKGITQLWKIIYTIGPCWSVSMRPNDEELREVDIMQSKMTLNNYEIFLQFYNKYRLRIY